MTIIFTLRMKKVTVITTIPIEIRVFFQIYTRIFFHIFYSILKLFF